MRRVPRGLRAEKRARVRCAFVQGCIESRLCAEVNDVLMEPLCVALEFRNYCGKPVDAANRGAGNNARAGITRKSDYCIIASREPVADSRIYDLVGCCVPSVLRYELARPADVSRPSV